MSICLNFKGTGLGDQVCAEPIARFAKNLYADVTVLTDYPVIFKHIDININPNKILSSICVAANPYSCNENGWVVHPFAEYIIPGRIHSIDFMSLFMLRQQLPFAYKKVHLDVCQETKERLLKEYPNIEKSWLIHPGYGAPAKSWGLDFWQNLAVKLQATGLETICIGKNYESMHIQYGVYPIACTYDASNQWDLMTLITAISMAKGVLTTDSAPLHIAGAFDKRIVVLPSIKHSDFIMPFRYSSKLYSAVLAECPYYDEYSLTPHLNTHSCVGQLITPLQPKHIPSVSSVIEAVLELDKRV